MTDKEVLEKLRELGWNPTDDTPVEVRFKTERGMTYRLTGINHEFEFLNLYDSSGDIYCSGDIVELWAYDLTEEKLKELAYYQMRIEQLKSELNP